MTCWVESFSSFLQANKREPVSRSPTFDGSVNRVTDGLPFTPRFQFSGTVFVWADFLSGRVCASESVTSGHITGGTYHGTTNVCRMSSIYIRSPREGSGIPAEVPLVTLPFEVDETEENWCTPQYRSGQFPLNWYKTSKYADRGRTTFFFLFKTTIKLRSSTV